MAGRGTQFKLATALIGLSAPHLAAAQCPTRGMLIGGGYVALETAAIAFRHDQWWPSPRRSFRIRTGGSASANQDVLLHGAVAYHVSQLATPLWRWACVGRAAPWLGAATALLLELPKEIGDGFHDSGFDLSDMSGAAIGALLPALHQTAPATRLVSLKGNWWPSAEYRHRPAGGLPRIENDYAGQRYFLSFVPGRVWPGTPVPWLGVAIGHSTAAWASEPPTHEWYLALDFELRRLPVHGRVWDGIAAVIDQIKIPLPGLRLHRGSVGVGLY